LDDRQHEGLGHDGHAAAAQLGDGGVDVVHL
jgi:hypothetical protein